MSVSTLQKSEHLFLFSRYICFSPIVIAKRLTANTFQTSNCQSETKMASHPSSSDLFLMIKSLLPDLSSVSHKGDAGRIGVIGGCREYTGAPYFAGISALKTGCDLVHIFCAQEAASVIKSYSPELIVHPVLDIKDGVEEISEWLPRLHSLVIGPGLGRNEGILENVEGIITKALSLSIPLVIDADGLFFITRNPDLIKGQSNVTLTPNAIEFSRLYEKLNGCRPPADESDVESVTKVSQLLGDVTVVRKGALDIIVKGKLALICNHEGSFRRCGGQGDLLSGSMAVFTYWAQKESSKKMAIKPFLQSLGPSLCASYAACWLTRECNRTAFVRCRRSTTTTDMIKEIGQAIATLEN